MEDTLASCLAFLRYDDKGTVNQILTQQAKN